MRKSLRLLLASLLLVLPLLLVACGPKVVKQYDVTFDLDGGTGLVADVTLDEGSYVAEPTNVSKTGYLLDGWYNEEVKWDFENNKLTSDVTLKAKWNIRTDIEANVELYMQKFVSGVPTTDYVKVESANYPNGLNAVVSNLTYGTSTNITNEVNAVKSDNMFYGYTFNATKSVLTIDALAVSNNVLKVYFDAVEYTVTYTGYEGASAVKVYPAVTDVLTEPQATKTGYTLDGFYNGQTKWNFADKVTADVTLEAKWNIRTDITYTIEVYKQKFVGGVPVQEFEKLAVANYPQGIAATVSNQTFGAAVDVTTLANSGLNDANFAGYQVDVQSVLTIEALAESGNVIKIYYRAFGYTVTFTGLETTQYANVYPTVSSKVTAPEVSKDGYVLDGFYNGEVKWNFNDDVTADLTLEAKWNARTDIAYTVEIYMQDQEAGTPKQTYTKVEGQYLPQGITTSYNDGVYNAKLNIKDKAEAALLLTELYGFKLNETLSVLEIANLALTDNVFKVYYSFVSYTVVYNQTGVDTVTVYPAINGLLTEPTVTLFAKEVTSWKNGEATWNFATDKVTADMALTPVIETYKYDYEFTKNNATADYVTITQYGNPTLTGNGIVDGNLVLNVSGQAGVYINFPEELDISSYVKVLVRISSTVKNNFFVYANFDKTGTYLGAAKANTTTSIDVKETVTDKLNNLLIKCDAADSTGTITVEYIGFVTEAIAQPLNFASPYDLDDAKVGCVGQYNADGTFKAGKAGHNLGVVACDGATDGYALKMDTLNNAGELQKGWNSVLTILFDQPFNLKNYSSVKIRIKGVDADGKAVKPANFGSLTVNGTYLTGVEDNGWWIYDAMTGPIGANGLNGFYMPNTSNIKYLYVDYVQAVEREGTYHLVTVNGGNPFVVADGEKVTDVAKAFGKVNVWKNGTEVYDLNTPVTTDLTLTYTQEKMYFDTTFTTYTLAADSTHFILVEATGGTTEGTDFGNGKLMVNVSGVSGLKLVFAETVDLTAYSHIWLKYYNNTNKSEYTYANWVDKDNKTYLVGVGTNSSTNYDVMTDVTDTLSNIYIKNDWADTTGTIQVEYIGFVTLAQGEAYNFSTVYDFDDASIGKVGQYNADGTLKNGKAGHNLGVVAVSDAKDGYALKMDTLDNNGDLKGGWNSVLTFLFPQSYSLADYTSIKIWVKCENADGTFGKPSSFGLLGGEYLTGVADGNWYVYDAMEKGVSMDGVRGFFMPNSNNFKYVYVDQIVFTARDGNNFIVSVNGGLAQVVASGDKVSDVAKAFGKVNVWKNGTEEYDLNTPVTSNLNLTYTQETMYFDTTFTTYTLVADATHFISVEATGGTTEGTDFGNGKLMVNVSGANGLKLVFANTIDLTAYSHVWLKVNNNTNKSEYTYANWVDANNRTYLVGVTTNNSAKVDIMADVTGTLSNIYIKNDFADTTGTVQVEYIGFVTKAQGEAYNFSTVYDFDDAAVGQVRATKVGHNQGIVAVADANDGYALMMDTLKADGTVATGWNSVLEFKLVTALSYADYTSVKIRVKAVNADGDVIKLQNFGVLDGDDEPYLTGTQDGNWYLYEAFEKGASMAGVLGFYMPNNNAAKYVYIDEIVLTARDGSNHLVSINGKISVIADGEKVTDPACEFGLKNVWKNGTEAFDVNTPVTSDLTLTYEAKSMYFDTTFDSYTMAADSTHFISVKAVGGASGTGMSNSTMNITTANSATGSGIELEFADVVIPSGKSLRIKLTSNNGVSIYVNGTSVKYAQYNGSWVDLSIENASSGETTHAAINQLNSIKVVRNSVPGINISIDEVQIDYDYGYSFEFNSTENLPAMTKVGTLETVSGDNKAMKLSYTAAWNHNYMSLGGLVNIDELAHIYLTYKVTASNAYLYLVSSARELSSGTTYKNTTYAVGNITATSYTTIDLLAGVTDASLYNNQFFKMDFVTNSATACDIYIDSIVFEYKNATKNTLTYLPADFDTTSGVSGSGNRLPDTTATYTIGKVGTGADEVDALQFGALKGGFVINFDKPLCIADDFTITIRLYNPKSQGRTIGLVNNGVCATFNQLWNNCDAHTGFYDNVITSSDLRGIASVNQKQVITGIFMACASADQVNVVSVTISFN